MHVVRLCRSCTVWGPPEGSRTDDEQLRRARRAPARRKGPEVVALRGRGGYGSVKVLNIAAATVDWLAEELAMLFNDIKGSFAEVGFGINPGDAAHTYTCNYKGRLLNTLS